MFKKIFSKKILMTQKSYELVDIGANLAHPSFKNDIHDVILRAKQAGKLLKNFLIVF